MSVFLRKIGIIGVGHVGAHCAFSLVTHGICDELVLVDIIERKAVSETQDLVDCIKYLPHNVRVHVGDYADVSDCDIIIISVGIHTGSGSDDLQTRNRLRGLQNKIDLIDSFIPKIVGSGFKGIFIVITNPCDIIAHHIWKISGFDKSKVFATGTILDSARFCQVLSRETGIDHKSITAYTLGEHGDSQTAIWSHVLFGGKPLSQLEKDNYEVFGKLDKNAILEEVRKTAWVIYDGKGGTEFGIATALSKIVNTIYHDEKAVLPISTLLEGQYGVEGLFTSTPCVIDKDGINQIVELNLPDDELKAFQNSCKIINDNIKSIN